MHHAPVALTLVVSLFAADTARAAGSLAPTESVDTDAAPNTATDPDTDPSAESPHRDPTQVEAWVAEGAAAFEAGDYEQAILLFERAYAATGKPNLIFNIGRTHEELGNLQEAVDHYAEFVVQPGIDLETRQAATERIRVLREILRETAEEAAVAKTESTTAEEKPEPPPPVLAPASEARPAAAANDTTPRRRSTPPARIAGYALLGLGAATLATGGALGGIASMRVSAADDEALVTDGNVLRQDARPLAHAADGLFIAGGAVALAGIIAIGVSFAKPKAKSGRSQATALLPALGREYAGLTWAARF